MTDGSLEPLQHPLLVDAAEAQLRERILSGVLPAGAPIRESAIAQQMEISRGPVREALRRLEQAGLVVKPRNRSYAVSTFDERDVRELLELRSALEWMAGREAMHNPVALERRLREQLDTYIAVVDAGCSPLEALAADRRFHEEIVEAAGNKRLFVIYSTLRDHIDLTLREQITSADQSELKRYARAHEELLAPIAGNDTRGFVKALDLHIRNAFGIMTPEESLAALE